MEFAALMPAIAIKPRASAAWLAVKTVVAPMSLATVERSMNSEAVAPRDGLHVRHCLLERCEGLDAGDADAGEYGADACQQ